MGITHNVACCFKQILESGFYKSAVARSLTSHLTTPAQPQQKNIPGTAREVSIKS